MNKEDVNKILQNVLRYNLKKIDRAGCDMCWVEGLILIEGKNTGEVTWDPFLDYEMENSVEPLEYYGRDTIERVIKEWENKTM